MLRAVLCTKNTITILICLVFAGWWGHNKERRFKMEPTFDPVQGAGGWQISNLPVLSLAPYLASVEMFAEVGMDAFDCKKR
jgi:kynureninase